MINYAAERESAAFKDRAVPPKLAHAYVNPTIIELLVTEKGTCGKWMRRSWIVVCRGPRVDLLMSEPSFRLQKPAVSKIAFVSENSRVPIDPVMVKWGERKVRVVYPLLIGDPSRITAGEPAGVKIEC